MDYTKVDGKVSKFVLVARLLNLLRKHNMRPIIILFLAIFSCISCSDKITDVDFSDSILLEIKTERSYQDLKLQMPGFYGVISINDEREIRIDEPTKEIIIESVDNEEQHIVFKGKYDSEQTKLLALESKQLKELIVVSDIENLIVNNTNIQSVSDECLKNSPQLNSIAFKNNTKISSLPNDFLSYTSNINAFRKTFWGCTMLSDIPRDLFKTNVNATDFTNVFYACNIHTIPEELFTNNILAENFEGAFSQNHNLNVIPEKLFHNNINAKRFYSSFSYCDKLQSIPNQLFDNIEQGVYNLAFSDCTNLQGNAPTLWDDTNASGTFCFKGCTKLENFNDIPDSWK
ncbi:hypothetical protein [Saccharicrinis aurantiacus]|uniref:hypothetical protein n=1 Tax=Saccharicrinis aurantiacus TaxID=1849719 RepID=UPI00248FC813|nr:hypothetical protein [Saccharicrinis aurantiacus]